MFIDCFKWGLVIFDFGNEYQDVYIDLDELKSDFSGRLYEEKIANMYFLAVNRPKIGITLGINWYCLAHWKIMIFGGLIA